jgi:hypothetical protein
MGLVLLVFVVADGRALDIEDDDPVFGPLGVPQLAQGAGEAEQGPGREAGRVGEVADGVIGAVEKGVPVDEKEARRAQANLPSTIWPRMDLC